jgi:CMP-N,N'-diacetyllegionaminic acid synthase
MKIISIIPVRGGSKGIPRKNLIKINKKSLLEYTVTASQKSKLIDRTIVCTEDKGIARVAKRLKSEVVNRPKRLATDIILAEPSIEFVLNYLKEENYIPDIIVFLQNTSPLRNEKDIDGAINMIKKGYDSVISGFKIHTYSWIQKKNTIKPLNYNFKKRGQRQNDEFEILQENGAMFITTYNSFMKSKNRISGKIGFYRMPIERSYNIDTPEDLKDMRNFLKEYSKVNK